MEERVAFGMFFGEYEHNIDDKGRLIIPSKFREALGKDFVITKGLDCCLFVFSTEEWEIFVNKLRTLPISDKDARDFTRFFFSGASECATSRGVSPFPRLSESMPGWKRKPRSSAFPTGLKSGTQKIGTTTTIWTSAILPIKWQSWESSRKEGAFGIFTHNRAFARNR